MMIGRLGMVRLALVYPEHECASNLYYEDVCYLVTLQSSCTSPYLVQLFVSCILFLSRLLFSVSTSLNSDKVSHFFNNKLVIVCMDILR